MRLNESRIAHSCLKLKYGFVTNGRSSAIWPGAKRVLQEPMNSHRLLVSAARESAAALGLSFQSYSQDWVLELARG